MTKTSFLTATLAISPLAALLPGCGGGSNGLPFGSPTATPVSQTIQPLRFALSDGRLVTLNLTTSGNRATGVLNTSDVAIAIFPIPGPVVDLRWDGGIYNVSGAFTPPLRIDLSGQVRQNGVRVPLKYVGTLPTQTTPGIFSISAAGKVAPVTLPALGGTSTTATPATTPIATATPTDAR